MEKQELIDKITDANIKYRAGNSVISDAEYDELVELFEKSYPEEYGEFRDSLNEGQIETGVKVEHPYIMGSLDKMTFEKPDDISKFLKKYVKNSLNVSAKVDGISCRLHYSNGILTGAYTRGDGYKGIDITDRICLVRNVLNSISIKDDIDIRGELVITNDDFEGMTGFANPRNACAGIINRKRDSKEWNDADLYYISFICYTVLGGRYTKKEQFELLEKEGFKTAWHKDYTKDEITAEGFICRLEADAEVDYEYPTDGLVISDSAYVNEERYRPEAAKALKLNALSAVTRLVDIEWQRPSKDGKIAIVGIIDPVELGGSVIGRVTLNNLDYIEKLGLKYGSKVKVMKRGDVIPALTEVILNDMLTRDIELPTECPCCGGKLVEEGPFLWCRNPDCQDQTTHRLTHFIKKMGVECSSFKTLENFGIKNFNDLINFVPDKKYKSQLKLWNELNSKVFTKSAVDIFCALNIQDVGERLQRKIVEFYGWDFIKGKPTLSEFKGRPEGIGDITLEKFVSNFGANIDITNKILANYRYSYKETPIAAKTEKKGSICFTGSLNTMGRSEASKLAEEAGYEVKGTVTRGLTYLVTNDKNSGSSKNKKAQQFGTKIIDEQEFLKLVNNTNTDIMDL